MHLPLFHRVVLILCDGPRGDFHWAKGAEAPPSFPLCWELVNNVDRAQQSFPKSCSLFGIIFQSFLSAVCFIFLWLSQWPIQILTHTPLHPLSALSVEENQAKKKKLKISLMGWDKNHFIIETNYTIIMIVMKRRQRDSTQEKCFTMQLFTTIWLTPCLLQSNKVSPGQIPPVYVLSMTFCGIHYPLVLAGSAVLAVFSQLLMLTGRAWETGKSLI